MLTPRAPGLPAAEDMDGVRVHRYGYFLRRFELLSYGGGILPKLKANPLLFTLVPFLIVGLAIAVRARLKSRDYDVIHAHWIIPQGLCACVARRSTKAAIVVTSHGGDLFGLRAAPFRWLKSWTLARCDFVSVVSRYMQDILLSEHDVPVERCRVIPMGVDLSERFTTTAIGAREPGRLVFVGRLVEKKGVAHLIEAVDLLVARFPFVRLDIVGDGPLRGALETHVQRQGLSEVIRFHGALSQAEIPRFLQTAAVAVVPSVVDSKGDQEGLGLVTIEAMGCGCPVVASDLPAIRDVVQHEHTGLLAKPADPADLAEKIARLLEEPDMALTLADNARGFVSERFDWDHAADAYATLFEEVVGT